MQHYHAQISRTVSTGGLYRCEIWQAERWILWTYLHPLCASWDQPHRHPADFRGPAPKPLPSATGKADCQGLWAFHPTIDYGGSVGTHIVLHCFLFFQPKCRAKSSQMNSSKNVPCNLCSDTKWHTGGRAPPTLLPFSPSISIFY